MSNLKKRRTELGMSQSSLSLKANVPEFIIQRYEASEKTRKPISYALALAKALEADVEYLFSN